MLKIMNLCAHLIIFIEQEDIYQGSFTNVHTASPPSSPLLMEWRYTKSKGAVFLLVTKELTVLISMYHVGFYQFGADTDECSTF